MLIKPINIGVVGVGHLGIHHVKHYTTIPNVNLLGIYDPDVKRSNYVAIKYKTVAFKSLKKLIGNVDALSIVTPTPNHYKTAKLCIENKKHVFIEKPITVTLEEANKLLDLGKNNSTIIQVGHIERLNPALMALEPYYINPKFIEIQRLAPYTARGTDVPVVLDKMIHDIDIILSLISSEVKNISSSGVSVISDSPDIANARIEFHNGAVANLTASRISLKNMRKLRFFQKETYISVDLYNKKVEVVKMTDASNELDEFALTLENAEGKKKQILFETPKIINYNAIQIELENFANSINNNKKSIVSLEDATKALKVAYSVINSM